MPLHNADAAFAAACGRHINLRMDIVRIAPTPAFEQTVCRSDLTKGNATRQIASPVDHASPELAYVRMPPRWRLPRAADG
ncbi:MAG: hypothetical protein WBY67_22145, partial [Pseudolabrys sp.]